MTSNLDILQTHWRLNFNIRYVLTPVWIFSFQNLELDSAYSESQIQSTYTHWVPNCFMITNKYVILGHQKSTTSQFNSFKLFWFSFGYIAIMAILGIHF